MTDDYIYGAIAPPAYEGASVDWKNKRSTLYNSYATRELSQDEAAVREIQLLRQRSLNAYRNDGTATVGINNYVRDLGQPKIAWVTAGKKPKIHSLMQDLWDGTMYPSDGGSPNLDGRGDLDNTIAENNFANATYGEGFCRMLIRMEQDKSKLPIKLQLLHPNQRAFNYSGSPEDISAKRVTRFGITFEDNKPLKYWFYKSNLENQEMLLASKPAIVPVEVLASELTHMFNRTDVGQWIGIPLLAPVLNALYNLKDLKDVTVSKQAVSAILQYIVSTMPGVAPTALGSVSTHTEDVVDDKGNIAEKKKIHMIANSKSAVHYSNPGQTITTAQGADIGESYGLIVKNELQLIAATLGQPYFRLTGDTKDINYAMINAVVIDHIDRLRFIHNLQTFPLFLFPIANYAKKVAMLYNRKVSNAIPVLQLPKFSVLDPLKQMQADKLAMSVGGKTIQQQLSENHITEAEFAEHIDTLKRLGLAEAILGGNGQVGDVNPATNSVAV